MASISKSKLLLGFTSPRTVEKIVPEIKLLTDKFSGQKWERNPELHKEFFFELSKSDFYEGTKTPNDPGFAGRDRITRAPKAYGFIDLNPTVKLTEIGHELITTKRPHEVYLKQMLKFQLPSYYHKDKTNRFNVKPYLELIRLIDTMKGISKTELSLFFTQLIHHNKFDIIVQKIKDFRSNAKLFKGSRKTYVDECFNKEVFEIFSDEIKSNNLKRRQSDNESLKEFLKTKKSTMRDYGDAFMRHIRATQIISFEKRTLRLIISSSKVKDVDFILNNIDKDINEFKTEKDFKDYLFSSTSLQLFTDNENKLVEKLNELGEQTQIGEYSINILKDKIDILEKQIFETNIENTKQELKTYKEFDDIINIFVQIKNRDVPDAPLFLEWNVWRALVMINYSKRVDGNFIMDLEGVPLNTAGGGKPDIEAEYNNFGLITEVTMSGGNTQFNMEGESVPRHFGDFKKLIGKETYCLFIAPKISEGALAHYFNLNRFNTKSYGGQTKIVPLTIDQFVKFLHTAKNNNFNDSLKLQTWMENICKYNQTCEDEEEWSLFINNSIEKWAA